MKSYLVSLLAVLLTVQAISGLRYFRTSFDNVDSYRIRDTAADPKNTNAPSLLNIADEADEEPEVPEKVTSRPQNAEKPLRGSALPERLPSTDDQGATNEQFYDDDATDAEMIPQTAPVNNSAKPNNEQYPNRRGDKPAFTDFGIFGSSDQVPQNGVSPATLNRLKQFASLTSVLANIARIPRAIALQIDSVISGLQTTYPTNTNVGAYMMGTRFLLRNQNALRPFDMMERAGLGRLDELVSSMPSIFSPIVNAVVRVASEIANRSAALIQRARETVRRLTEGASRSLAGFNVARNDDSYSVSVPNVIDMVLRGRLAQKLDELFTYLRRLLGSGLYNIGSAFVPSGSVGANAIPARNPVSAATRPSANQPYQMRTLSRLSNLRHYRPSRYFRQME